MKLSAHVCSVYERVIYIFQEKKTLHTLIHGILNNISHLFFDIC